MHNTSAQVADWVGLKLLIFAREPVRLSRHVGIITKLISFSFTPDGNTDIIVIAVCSIAAIHFRPLQKSWIGAVIPSSFFPNAYGLLHHLAKTILNYSRPIKSIWILHPFRGSLFRLVFCHGDVSSRFVNSTSMLPLFLSAAHIRCSLVIVQMQPSVSSEFYPLNHILSLVVSSWLFVFWIAIHNRGP